jgi:translation initiation factor IF-1
MSQNDQTIKKEGLVLEALPGDLFKVRFGENEEALGYLSGRMRMNHIRVLPGDKVDVELSLHDLKRGRIVRRF